MMVLRQETPLPGEAFITDIGLRMLAVPPEYSDMRIPASMREGQGRTDAINRGRELFGAECSFCHGNNGRGDAPLGMTMYPAAANLTESRTQTKSDGQLFWLIAHGVNLTGMPAFGQKYGGPHNDEELWNLVAFVRSLDGR
jgi:mono/diheme cytochrome c family protein